MTGGKNSSTPWHLTIGNPYSPWLSTNHIIVKSATISTSTELTYNDMPQWVTAKIMCEFSRSLGKQELLRMFNNSCRRTYSTKLVYQQEKIITPTTSPTTTPTTPTTSSTSPTQQPITLPINR
jgi:hypothetical protein